MIRQLVLGCLSLVLAASSSAGQLVMQPTPPPLVTADRERWFQLGEPITHDGDVLLPAGPKVFFDGNVMERTGSFRGIPLYVDRTRGPLSPILVPVSGQLMQPYVRVAIEELGTPVTGGRILAFDLAGTPELETVIVSPPGGERALDERLLVVPQGPPSRPELVEPPGRMATAQEPAGAQAIFIEWSGARWRGVGPTAELDPDRFVVIGEHGGFPVYALRGDYSGRRIFLSVRPGFVTAYERMTERE